MEHRILTLQETSGVPAVDVADQVTEQHGPWFTAHGPIVPGENTKWTRHAVAHLYKLQAGYYVVFAELPEMSQINQLGTGKTVEQLAGDWHYYRVEGTRPDPDNPSERIPYHAVERIQDVPPQAASQAQPWNVGNKRITKAVPTMPSTVGGHDMAEIVNPNEEVITNGTEPDSRVS